MMLLLWSQAQADCLAWEAPGAVATAQGVAFDEVSGLAISRQHPGVGWVIEDSGNRPILYALELETGKVLSRVRLDASNHDWEDVALGACPGAKKDCLYCLYVGDFGDNLGIREDLGILWLEEPATLARRLRRDPSWLPFKYPSLVHQDAEAMFVGADGTLRVVSKRRDGDAVIYQLPFVLREGDWHAWAREERRLRISRDGVLHPEEQRPPWRVTAAALDGETLILRTYEGTFAFRGETRSELLSPPEPQGEAIAIDPRDESLWFVSEQSPVLYRAACSQYGS
jgi:hypothetical protein